MPVYLYTTRRARLSKISKYFGLISKLFSDMYNEPSITSRCDAVNRQK